MSAARGCTGPISESPSISRSRGVHLVGAHAAARAHRPVTGDAAEHRVEPRAQNRPTDPARRSRPACRAEAARPATCPRSAGTSAHGDGTGAEPLDHKAERGKVLGMLQQPARHRRPRLNDLGDQERLPGDAVVRHLPLQPLVKTSRSWAAWAYDKDHPRLGLGDDVILVGSARAARAKRGGQPPRARPRVRHGQRGHPKAGRPRPGLGPSHSRDRAVRARLRGAVQSGRTRGPSVRHLGVRAGNAPSRPRAHGSREARCPDPPARGARPRRPARGQRPGSRKPHLGFRGMDVRVHQRRAGSRGKQRHRRVAVARQHVHVARAQMRRRAACRCTWPPVDEEELARRTAPRELGGQEAA